MHKVLKECPVPFYGSICTNEYFYVYYRMHKCWVLVCVDNNALHILFHSKLFLTTVSYKSFMIVWIGMMKQYTVPTVQFVVDLLCNVHVVFAQMVCAPKSVQIVIFLCFWEV
jgi:hypothetical protein